MDWRGRKYYCVSFDWRAYEMRVKILKSIDNKVKFYPYKDIPKQPDEIEERGHYHYLVSVPIDYSDSVEYALRKAERNDDWCRWKEIKRNVLKGN